ncbi:unnamed protein product [Caenorhabditis angaria]|uniref:Integumentary mucin C.1-like n=1 Tax=Caenorhabditis angaria TaxID=860376 RepID=A0A9P1IHK8_9PELO|nr:unnamed protein product [Caenorhabditis angaria]
MKILPIFLFITVVSSFGFVRKSHPRNVRKIEESQSCSEEKEEVRGNGECEEEVKSTKKPRTDKPKRTRKPSTTKTTPKPTTTTELTTPKPSTTTPSTTTTTTTTTACPTTTRTELPTTTTPKPTTASTTTDPLRNPSTPFEPNTGGAPELQLNPAENTEDVAIENTPEQLRKPDSPLNPSKVNVIPDLGFGFGGPSRDEGLGGTGNLQNSAVGSQRRIGFSVEVSTPKPVVLAKRLL